MKAPDKIYIEPNLDSIWGMAERSCESEIEYVRADALIKKAEEWLKLYILNHDNIDVYQIGEDFKNYMKGE